MYISTSAITFKDNCDCVILTMQLKQRKQNTNYNNKVYSN